MFKLKTTMAPKIFCLTALALACVGHAQAEKVVWRAKGTVNRVDYVRPSNAAERPAAPVNMGDVITVEVEFDTNSTPVTSWTPLSIPADRNFFSAAPTFIRTADGCATHYPLLAMRYKIGNGSFVSLPSTEQQGSILKLNNCRRTSTGPNNISPFFNQLGQDIYYNGGTHIGYFSAGGLYSAQFLFLQGTLSNAGSSGANYETNFGKYFSSEFSFRSENTKPLFEQTASLILSLATFASNAIPLNRCGTSNALTPSAPVLSDCLDSAIPLAAAFSQEPDSTLKSLAVSTIAFPHISLLFNQFYGVGDAAPFTKSVAAYMTTVEITSVERVLQEAELIVSLRAAAKSLGFLGLSLKSSIDLIDYYYKQNKPVAACIMVRALKTSEFLLRPFARTTIDAMIADTKTLSGLLRCAP